MAFLELEGRTLELRQGFVGAVPPVDPEEGQVWVDTAQTPYRVLRYLRIDAGNAAWPPLAVLQSNQEHSLAAYNLACIAALSGERESALQLLQLAVAHGFNDAAYIQRDGDVASLRGDPRFRGIVDQASRMR